MCNCKPKCCEINEIFRLLKMRENVTIVVPCRVTVTRRSPRVQSLSSPSPTPSKSNTSPPSSFLAASSISVSTPAFVGFAGGFKDRVGCPFAFISSFILVKSAFSSFQASTRSRYSRSTLCFHAFFVACSVFFSLFFLASSSAAFALSSTSISLCLW